MKYPRYYAYNQQIFYDKVMDKACNKHCPKCKNKTSLRRQGRVWLIECAECKALFKVKNNYPLLRIGAKDPKLQDSSNWKATCSECGGVMDYYNLRYGCRKCGHILEV